MPENQDPKPVLYVVRTKWCAPCQKFKRDYFAKGSSLRRYLDRRWKIKWVDGDAKENKAFLDYYDINSVPCFAFEIDPANKRVFGYTRGDKLIDELNQKLKEQ